MATKSSRVNVTFGEATLNQLSHLARQEDMSVAGLVREFTLEALERREDFYLSKIAEKLDKEGMKTYSHKDAWK